MPEEADDHITKAELIALIQAVNRERPGITEEEMGAWYATLAQEVIEIKLGVHIYQALMNGSLHMSVQDGEVVYPNLDKAIAQSDGLLTDALWTLATREE